MSKAGENMMVHRVPEYNDEGIVKGSRYFPTITEAKEFAKEQMKDIGAKGYTVASIPGYRVCDLLEEHVPLPEWWRDITLLGDKDGD